MWVLLYLSLVIFSQDKTELSYEPTLGSSNLRLMDDIYTRARNLKDNEAITVLAQLGKEEDSRLNAYRVGQIKSLFNYMGIPLEKFVFLEGEPTNNYGRVDFYVSRDSKVIERYTFVANKNIGLALCCGDCDSWSYTPDFIKRKNRYKRYSRSRR